MPPVRGEDQVPRSLKNTGLWFPLLDSAKGGDNPKVAEITHQILAACRAMKGAVVTRNTILNVVRRKMGTAEDDNRAANVLSSWLWRVKSQLKNDDPDRLPDIDGGLTIDMNKKNLFILNIAEPMLCARAEALSRRQWKAVVNSRTSSQRAPPPAKGAQSMCLVLV